MNNIKRGIALGLFSLLLSGSLLADSCECGTCSCLGKVRIQKIPMAMQCWTFREFTFLETLDKIKELGIEYVEAYPGQPLSKDMPDVQMGPDLTGEQQQWVKDELNKRGLRLTALGVIHFDNTEEATRKVFAFAKAMGIPTVVIEPQYDDLSLIEQMVKEYDIKAAIHNHPKPSKYWNPETVEAALKGLDPRVGICCDTGHWMRSGVDPVQALRMFEGRIWNVHMKDLNEFGSVEAYDVPFGTGKGKIKAVLAELTLQNYPGTISVEHERKEEVMNPSPSIKKGLEYIQSITYFHGYERILGRWEGKYNKHGWNHYGPGYFELCEESGVLKSQGGMGLLWYSAKKYKDFVLELDFKSAKHETNSGIFLRVPEMPISDDYIYHSFEVQIDNASRGIHQTGAVYDAVAPSELAFNREGEWNHYKITMQGDHIKVELNGVQVIDWEMKPSGKINDFAKEGYIGLQNHDSRAPVYFKNILVKEL